MSCRVVVNLKLVAACMKTFQSTMHLLRDGGRPRQKATNHIVVLVLTATKAKQSSRMLLPVSLVVLSKFGDISDDLNLTFIPHYSNLLLIIPSSLFRTHELSILRSVIAVNLAGPVRPSELPLPLPLVKRGKASQHYPFVVMDTRLV